MFHLLLAIIYLAFISLGLPDSLLGSAWPSMYHELSVPVSYSGIIFMIIACGTIISSLLSDRLTKKFGTGRVTAFSVLMTAAALLGFSVSDSYLELCLWAIPYGLGAGSVDASLNNYVALHYASRHMSWLHAMWGLGTLLGPYIMAYALGAGQGWSWGYRYISILQIALTAVLVFSLPLWKTRTAQDTEETAEGDGPRKPLGIRGVLAIRGAREILVMFFCYCALESTAMLWASSYMVLGKGIDKTTAAMWGSLFCIGITVGRLASGFLTMRLSDPSMIRLGQALVLTGVIIMLLPLPHHIGTIAGLMVIGLGCAPIYPCVIHSTPTYFGKDKSQAIVGMQMAFAYVGSMCMPPLFGLIAQHVSVNLFPFYLVVFLVLMVAMHETLRRKCGDRAAA